MSPKARAHLRTDPFMAAVMDRVGPITHTPRRLPLHRSLISAIIHQQLGGAAAGTILGRFERLFGDHEFPSPEQIVATAPARLRSAGLSRPKAAYIQGVAAEALAGRLPSLADCDRMADEELIERLLGLKGVGRWTVEMVLIFNLGRGDILPIHDLGIRRGFQIAYRRRRLPVPEHLARYGQRWAPYRTTAALYLWQSVKFAKEGNW